MSQRRTDLEQALRHAARAAKQGDHAAAERWSKTAERLAAAVETSDAAQAADEEARIMQQAEAEQAVIALFVQVAHIALAMVHAPIQAPAAFQGLVKLWREHNLGEGEEDAERAAARLAASHAAFLEDRFEDTLPAYVRERLDDTWAERRAQLEGKPVVPPHWEDA
jgi:hypothetical protein